jgi:hypothetical protein
MGFWSFTSQHFMERGDLPFLFDDMHKLRAMVSYSSVRALSPDVDRLPAVLDVIMQTSGIRTVLAHAVRIPKMSLQTLARTAYPAYLEFRDAMRRVSPSFSDTGTQTVWVPMYCAYQAEFFGNGPIRWSLSRRKGGPFMIGNAARPKVKDAVAEAARYIEQYRSNVGSTGRKGMLLLDPKAPELHWFHRPPLASDPAAVAVESIWRTVKQQYPNEVTLAELAI